MANDVTADYHDNWFGYLTTATVDEIAARMRYLLFGHLWVFVAVNTEYPHRPDVMPSNCGYPD